MIKLGIALVNHTLRGLTKKAGPMSRLGNTVADALDYMALKRMMRDQEPNMQNYRYNPMVYPADLHTRMALARGLVSQIMLAPHRMRYGKFLLPPMYLPYGGDKHRAPKGYKADTAGMFYKVDEQGRSTGEPGVERV